MIRRYCNFVAHNPATAFGIALFTQTLLPVITLLLHLFGSDVLPADFNDVPLVLQDDESYKSAMLWNLRKSDRQQPIMEPATDLDWITGDWKLRQIPSDVLELYFETRDGSNILTSQNLADILSFENALLSVKNYKSYCVVRGFTCLPTKSLARTVEDFTKTPNETSDAQVLLNFYSSDDIRPSILEFVTKDVNVSATVFHSTKLRSYAFVAWAVGEDGYTTRDYASEVLHPWLYKAAGRSSLQNNSNIRFSYFNNFLYYDYLHIQAILIVYLECQHWSHCKCFAEGRRPKAAGVGADAPPFSFADNKQLVSVVYDLLLALGSLVFIYLFCWSQMRSLFVTTFGIYGILTCFFGANLIYRYVCDYRYFGIFHVLAIFIILGIGVDDIFVFTDAWSCVGRNQPDLPRHEQLYRSYCKAALSMLATSLTTASAFLTNVMSPLLAIGSFGLFAGILVIVNFVSVITYFPTVIIVNDSMIEKKRQKNGEKIVNDNSDVKPAVKYEAGVVLEPDIKQTSQDRNWRVRLCNRLCRGYTFLIWSPLVQAVVLLGTALTVACMAYATSTLTVDEDQVRLYRQTHHLGHAQHLRSEYFEPAFYEADDRIQMFLMWGFREYDRSECHKTDWRKCRGHVVWDDLLDLNDYTAQKQLLSFCNFLNQLPTTRLEELHIQVKNGRPQVLCFISEFDRYLKNEVPSELLGVNGPRTGLPSSETKIGSLMIGAPEIYRAGLLHDMPFFDRFFELGAEHWLYDGYKAVTVGAEPLVARIQSYGELIGMTSSSPYYETTMINNVSVSYGSRLRYFAIRINTTVKYNMVTHTEGLKLMKNWAQFVNNSATSMTPQLRNVILGTPVQSNASLGIWHWFKVQETLVTSATTGLLISLSIALPVLCILTDDIAVGLLAGCAIVCTTVSVIGVIPLAGYKLGVLESINLTLVVGLAVDYIVHISEAYHFSMELNRKDKVAQALRDVGLSVVSGALSTLGASIFMCFAQIVFFMQFGLFIFCTVGFSVLYSFGVFSVMLAIAGPQSDRFRVSRIAQQLVHAMSRMTRIRVSLGATDEVQQLGGGNDTDTTVVSRSSKASKTNPSIDDDNLSSSDSSGAKRATARPRSRRPLTGKGRVVPNLPVIPTQHSLVTRLAADDHNILNTSDAHTKSTGSKLQHADNTLVKPSTNLHTLVRTPVRTLPVIRNPPLTPLVHRTLSTVREGSSWSDGSEGRRSSIIIE